MSKRHPPAYDVVETHISVLFFTPERVYKLLKPMRTGFLDHRDPGARAAAVATELELNRRFAPDVYLGLGKLWEGAAGDPPVEQLLVMRRLPDDRRLSSLVDHPDIADHLRGVVRLIAGVHAQSPPIHDAVPLATAAGIRGFWESSFAEIEPSVGTVIDDDEFSEVRYLALGYLDHHVELFERRRAAGYVRDGHGDLTADDIFVLDDGPRVLDCLAFDDSYRISDVLADIAFLAMDVERLAGRALSTELLRWYREFTGEHHPSSLAHHYVAYRAHVRAKVATIRHRQGDDPSRELARSYHSLTLAHLRRARPTVVLVGGGPGTGKTTLTGLLADRLNWASLDSDELRKDLHGVAHDDHRFEDHPDLYSDESTDRTYRELLERADALLTAGESAILDATWRRAEHRDLAREVARRHGAELIELECTLPAAIARERIADRGFGDASDATPELVDRAMGLHDEWRTAISVDTIPDPRTTVDDLLEQVFHGR